MIELNKKYSGKQLAELLFNVSPGTFRNDKESYLNYMSEFFEWHQEGTRYIFTRIIKEYIPKAKGRKSTKEQTSTDYKHAISELIKEEPWNTGAGIARDITINNNYMASTYHHKVRTAYNYTQPIMKTDYDIVDRRWRAYIGGEYVDMEDNELIEWKNLMNACFGNRKDISLEQDLAVMHDNGDITDQEYQEALAKINDNKYQAALDMWKHKYGYKPIKVNKYEMKLLEAPEEKM